MADGLYVIAHPGRERVDRERWQVGCRPEGRGWFPVLYTVVTVSAVVAMAAWIARYAQVWLLLGCVVPEVGGSTSLASCDLAECAACAAWLGGGHGVVALLVSVCHPLHRGVSAHSRSRLSSIC